MLSEYVGTYQLARLGIGQAGAAITQIALIRGVDTEEYQRFLEAKRHFAIYTRQMALFESVMRNSQEFFDSLQAVEADGMVAETEMDDLRALSGVIEVNRRLLNLLMLFRTYLDHTEACLKRKFGEPSERLTSFEKATSTEYDSSFAYRFMYGLRHYAQHYDMPLGGIETRITMADPGDPSKGHRHELVAEFSRDGLLENNFDWKAGLRKEIEQLPSSFNIVPIVQELLNCLLRIHSAVVERDVQAVEPSASYLMHLASEAGGLSDRVGICELSLTAESKITVRMDYLPNQALLKYLSHKGTLPLKEA